MLSQLTPQKQAAWQYADENQERVKISILTALLPMYEQWKAELDAFGDEEFEGMPTVETIEQFADQLRLVCIYLFDTDKDGVSYAGYCFSTTWEEEHGIGFIVHKDQVLRIGPMSMAMTTPADLEE